MASLSLLYTTVLNLSHLTLTPRLEVAAERSQTTWRWNALAVFLSSSCVLVLMRWWSGRRLLDWCSQHWDYPPRLSLSLGVEEKALGYTYHCYWTHLCLKASSEAHRFCSAITGSLGWSGWLGSRAVISGCRTIDTLPRTRAVVHTATILRAVGLQKRRLNRSTGSLPPRPHVAKLRRVPGRVVGSAKGRTSSKFLPAFARRTLVVLAGDCSECRRGSSLEILTPLGRPSLQCKANKTISIMLADILAQGVLREWL